jgi:hypothetical protein
MSTADADPWPFGLKDKLRDCFAIVPEVVFLSRLGAFF